LPSSNSGFFSDPDGNSGDEKDGGIGWMKLCLRVGSEDPSSLLRLLLFFHALVQRGEVAARAPSQAWYRQFHAPCAVYSIRDCPYKAK
jgi:hypothetical protein